MKLTTFLVTQVRYGGNNAGKKVTESTNTKIARTFNSFRTGLIFVIFWGGGSRQGPKHKLRKRFNVPMMVLWGLC